MSSLGTSWTPLSRTRRRVQARLVVAGGVEDELPEQRAVGAHDPDVVVRDEELHRPADVGPTQADVAEPAEIADGDVAGLAHPVSANPEVGTGPVEGRSGLEPGHERHGRGVAAQG